MQRPQADHILLHRPSPELYGLNYGPTGLLRSALSLNGTAGTDTRVVISGTGLALAMVARAGREDTMLRAEFREWNPGGKQVPWKLSPFVY